LTPKAGEIQESGVEEEKEQGRKEKGIFFFV